MNTTIESINKDTQEFINNNNKFIYKGDPFQSYIQSNIEGIGTFGMPDTVVTISKHKTSDALMYPEQLVFEATYNFDSDGKRHTEKLPGDRDKVAIFFGDAQTFGEGLNNNETLPYYYQYFNPEYIAYNYAFLGHGPSQMLSKVNSSQFKNDFASSKGEVFYILRDDAIKVTVGQVPWGSGYPKYILDEGGIKLDGYFGGNNYTPDNMYLPSMFTENDFDLTIEVIKETQKNLPSGLELTVVIIPLTFSHYKIQSLLERNNIKCINLYYTDLEYHTNSKARFLDGVHTKYANQVIANRITYFLKNNIENYNIFIAELNTLTDLYSKLLFEAFFIPNMVDFPYDDAGVIISNTLKLIKTDFTVSKDELIEYMKNIHDQKKHLTKDIEKNLVDIKKLLSIDSYYRIFNREYIELPKIQILSN